MLTPIINSQRAQLHTETDKPKEKEASSAQNSVAGKVLTSVLDEFLAVDEPADETNQFNNEIDPEIFKQSTSTDDLLESNETIDANATQLDLNEHQELVTELLESVYQAQESETQIEEAQLKVFPPVLTDDTDNNFASNIQNPVGTFVETLTNSPVDTQVKSFVSTADIAKLVSSKRLIFNPIGSDVLIKTVMLLKNGLAYTDLKTPPEELELPSSLESAEGTAWTFWWQDEETGEIYLGAEIPDDKQLLTGADIDLTPLSVEDIAGTHTKMRADIRGATQVTRWSDIIFNEDGTFEYSLSKLSTTGGVDTHWQESFKSSFTHVSANRPITGEDNSDNETKNIPNMGMYGTFKLSENGLSIELTYADHSIESRLIYMNDGYLQFGEKSYKTRHTPNDQLSRLRARARGQESILLLNPEWLAVVADSAAAVNDNRSRLNHLILAPERRPKNGRL